MEEGEERWGRKKNSILCGKRTRERSDVAHVYCKKVQPFSFPVFTFAHCLSVRGKFNRSTSLCCPLLQYNVLEGFVWFSFSLYGYY